MIDKFLFDDFFIGDNDPGHEVDVTLSGRSVPLTLKRGLTLADLEEAKSASLKTRMTASGNIELVNLNDHEFVIQVLLKAILKWPFEYATGVPVPINRESLERMMGDNAMVLQQLVLKIVQREDLTPFVNPSDEASSLTGNQETSSQGLSASASPVTNNSTLAPLTLLPSR